MSAFSTRGEYPERRPPNYVGDQRLAIFDVGRIYGKHHFGIGSLSAGIAALARLFLHDDLAIKPLKDLLGMTFTGRIRIHDPASGDIPEYLSDWYGQRRLPPLPGQARDGWTPLTEELLRNDAVLRAFEEGVTIPLWWALCIAQVSQRSVAVVVGANFPALKAALGLRRKREALSSVCDRLVALPAAVIRDAYEVYVAQNAAVRAGLAPVYVPQHELVKEIFSGFLYEEGFASESVWQHLQPEPFSRTVFHVNFRNDNKHVPACPYCDLDSVNAVSNRSIEHFLPRSKFPLLAMNALNMIPSCQACNMSWEGKGTRIIESAASPLVKDIGKDVEFAFKFSQKSIGVSARNHDASIQGYIDLVGLAPRYAGEQVFVDVNRAGDALFETFFGADFDDDTAVEYVVRVRAGAPLTRVLSAYVRQICIYFRKEEAP